VVLISDITKKQVEVVNEDKEGFFHKCKKCGYEFCKIIELGEILNNEKDVLLYRCLKCRSVERET